MTREQCIESLNNAKTCKRLSAVKKLKKLEKRDESLKPSDKPGDTNVQIHSFYSFSPYSPAKAAYMAYKSGLLTMGLSDHDTLAGAKEFIRACKILQRAYSIGFECRVRLNYGGEDIFAHVTACGLPDASVKSASGYLEGLRRYREAGMLKLTENFNQKFKAEGIYIDFENDVLPVTLRSKGGSVTERHILFVLAKKLIEKYSKGEKIVEFLQKNGYQTDEMQRAFLSDESNPFYEYDLLVALKGRVKSFYNPQKGECEDIERLVSVVKALGGFVAYQCTDSLKFDGENLDGFIEYLKSVGVSAVAYSPSKTDAGEIESIQEVCSRHELLEIDGDTINAPRQKFGGQLSDSPRLSKLAESSWAIIGHSKMVNLDIQNGMFTQKAIGRSPSLSDRVAVYARIGKSGYVEPSK